MSEEDETTREYFPQDLKDLSKQFIYESPAFQNNLMDYCREEFHDHSFGLEKFIYTTAEVLTCEEKTLQKGHMLKSNRVALQRNNQDLRRKSFLRHFSTLLYYKLREKYEKMTKVQVMWLSHPSNKNHIYVAANPYDTKLNNKTRKFNESCRKESDFCGFLVELKKRCPSKMAHTYDTNRIKRAKAKLDNDLEFIKTLKVTNSNFKIEFVSSKNGSYYREMHAEKNLCDEAERIRQNNLCQVATFYIYGKKCPCISCFSRMEMANIHDFNKHHGKFWFHGIKCRDTNGKHIRNVVVNTQTIGYKYCPCNSVS